MKQMTEQRIAQLLKSIDQIQGKGDPILLIGTTGSGKSALITECAKSDTVLNLLSIRESSGKGSLIPTTVCVTDHKDIPDDCLIMTADVYYQTLASCNDDNRFLGDLLYRAAKEYARSSQAEKYNETLSNEMDSALMDPANDSLAYKLKGMDEEQRKQMLNILLKFSIEDVMAVYYEMRAKNPPKGQRDLFIDLLSTQETLRNLIEEFWKAAVEHINHEAENLRHALEEAGADVKMKISTEGYHFVAVLSKEDIDDSNPIVCTLLKSENGSEEHLLSNVSLIFRGMDQMFEVPYKDTLTVAETESNQIHCVKFIDTQGLFHSTGLQSADESERIIDLLSEYHSNRLLLVTNSEIYNTTKDGHEAIKTMLQAVNRDIEIYILFTHWDIYLKDTINQTGTVSRSRTRNSIDWEEKYSQAFEKQQKEVVERLNKALELNVSQKKPKIVGVYRTARILEYGNKMEDILEQHKISYEHAIPTFTSDLATQIAIKGPKYRVTEDIIKKIDFDIPTSEEQSISALYNNLVACKGLRLYASTVRACIRKWCDFGGIHESEVTILNYHGFQNINTYFVREIRNYAMLYAKKIQLQLDGSLPNEEDTAAFEKDLMKDLMAQQNLGRQVARILGQKAYQKGFEQCKGFRYQYQRFEDMLQYLQSTYFMSPSISMTPQFKECLIQAARRCIANFIDAKCVVVY